MTQRGPGGRQRAARLLQAGVDAGRGRAGPPRRLPLQPERADGLLGGRLLRALLRREEPGAELAAVLQHVHQHSRPRLLGATQRLFAIASGHRHGQQSVVGLQALLEEALPGRLVTRQVATPVLDEGHRLLVGGAGAVPVAQRLLGLADGHPGTAGAAPALARVDDGQRPPCRGQGLGRLPRGQLRRAERLQGIGQVHREPRLQAHGLAEVAHRFAAAAGYLFHLPQRELQLAQQVVVRGLSQHLPRHPNDSRAADALPRRTSARPASITEAAWCVTSPSS